MKNLVLFLALLNVGIEALAQDGELKAAFEYLNKVRSAPADYSRETGVDLGYVGSAEKLKPRRNL